MKKLILSLIFGLFLLAPLVTFGHQPKQSLIYLRIYEEAGIEGRFEVNANELIHVFGLDVGLHPSIEQVRPYQDKIQAYLLKNAKFSSELGSYKIVFTGEITKLNLNYGDFINFHFRLENSKNLPDSLTLDYNAFFNEDPTHMCLVAMEYNWKAGLINNEHIVALYLSEGERNGTFSIKETSLWKGFVAMVQQGIWHIWIGMDHILFLVALILPSVVRRRKKNQVTGGFVEKSKYSLWGWEPVKKFRPAFMYILKIVTFFTIAHTITLSLASLEIINLPSRVVESIIAFSVGLAAYHNIRPIFKGEDWVIAFVFGLFHGFGFASVLGDLGFRGEYLSLSLVGFNVGVEIGQVVIIAAIFPILYFIRNNRLYPKLMVWLSVLLIIISSYWLIERAFDIDLPLDEMINSNILYPIAHFVGLK
ncbi:HupE/UreJ family protein [Zobellia uliginosa]|uniref:HupE/UreJ family protein n=1 Tax=Zobellia uliginosa TaxID=143224 RepID=UPI001C07D065|nr:HupE/UreJ family protein [Zobellia uliginosa]MBU2945683.1 HupE/UreJ family protein [Zobellia uliginosa]